MNNEEYQNLLNKIPKDNTDDFIFFLRDHNEVVVETFFWLLITNIKYHKENSPHYTLFAKRYVEYRYQINDEEWKEYVEIVRKYQLQDFFEYTNCNKNKSIKRLQIHFRYNGSPDLNY